MCKSEYMLLCVSFACARTCDLPFRAVTRPPLPESLSIFQAAAGYDMCKVHRDISLCAHAIIDVHERAGTMG
jgi:hypothetical protein